uniref:Hemopexin a n=1 Tax=Myripristis murdjan TaxID=586833 RepID=A0A667ZDR5_9TELE
MKLLSQTLCLYHHLDHHHTDGVPDRCEGKGLEMDAVAVNEEGVPYFFHDHHLFKGFHGKAEMSNETFPELDDHVHVDAAFRMHYEDSDDHDHMFFFFKDKVLSYYQHKLEDGYPKPISEVFPGIPDHVDAAVECPKPECDEDSVIVFKGDMYHYDVKTKAVTSKNLQNLPSCTSAFRFMEHYYCFHGHQFTKFDPKTGDMHINYTKNAQDYFMRCSTFDSNSDHVEREQCSRVHLDAITSDNAGDIYAFRGHHYLHKDDATDALKAESIESAFKELHSEVDAVFSYEGHLHMIKDDNVFVYKVGEPHTHLDGYPKTVKEELGFEHADHIDAAFVCNDQHIAHIIIDDKIYDVDMKASPRVPTNERPMGVLKHVDAAMCGSTGVKAIVGNHFYHFDSVMLMVAAKALPEQHRVSQELFGCDH